MKTTVILNGASGTAQNITSDALVDQVGGTLSAWGWDHDIRVVTGEDLAASLEATAGDTELLIAGGGDGTIAAAAVAAINRAIPIAILPLGTMNVFARDLGLPLGLDGALDAIKDGAVRAVDVAYVDDRLFLNSVVLGTFARLARRREELRDASDMRGHYLHLRKALREFGGYGRRTFEVDDGLRSERVRAGTIQVTNNPLNPSLMPMPERASLSQGTLGCYIDHSRTKLGFAKASIQALLGGMPTDPTVTSICRETLTISTKRTAIPASVDGEVHIIKSPLRFRSAKGALKIRGGA